MFLPASTSLFLIFILVKALATFLLIYLINIVCFILIGFLLFISGHTVQMCRLPKQYVHNKDLTNHIRAKHSSISYACETCKQTFSYKKSLDRHIQAEHNEMAYRCIFCNASFSYRCNFKRHQKTVHNM